jgi:hypothetical protein
LKHDAIGLGEGIRRCAAGAAGIFDYTELSMLSRPLR